MRYSRRTRPRPSDSMFTKSPLRSPRACITPPWCCSSISAVTSSIGSCFSPLTSFITTRGLDTAISKPSRRMFSSRMVRCNSPRPMTSKIPSSPVSLTRKATLCCNSFCRRSQIWRLVTNLPSRPASGLVLTQKFIVSVGSSTFSMGSGEGVTGSVMVTPIPTPSMPLISTISPGPASVACTRSRPWKVNTWLTRPLTALPSGPSITTTSIMGLMVPWLIRPTPMRPTKVEKSSAEICNCSGASGSPFCAGTCLSTVLNSADMSGPHCSLGGPSTNEDQPLIPDAYTTGKSSCSSVAPSLSNKSNAAFTTKSGRAPGLSTLLTTRMGLRPNASAFLVTKRVCGIGPSCASISSTTPSTMLKARSTSPPKSAWPGVSTMLMCVPSQVTAQFLARIVMPRSFSIALLSITVSTTFSCSAKVPDWRSNWSTMVVLPWSTWAMMAILRICLWLISGFLKQIL